MDKAKRLSSHSAFHADSSSEVGASQETGPRNTVDRKRSRSHKEHLGGGGQLCDGPNARPDASVARKSGLE